MSKNQEEVAIEKLAEQIKLSPQKVFSILHDLNAEMDGLIKIDAKFIHITKNAKKNLIHKAINAGITLEQIIESLHWREFESFCLLVFDYNEYHTYQNFYFTQNKKRYEIDVVAIQQPFIFAVDAKKWKTGHSGALKTMVNNQNQRVKDFATSLHNRKIREKLALMNWKHAKIIPMIITSKMYEIKIFQKIPILPFFKLNQFLIEYHRYLGMIQQFPVNFNLQKSLF